MEEDILSGEVQEPVVDDYDDEEEVEGEKKPGEESEEELVPSIEPGETNDLY